MKIAQLAPPWLSVPPKGYGGTETVVHYVTEGLVKKGHDVTLFSTGNSRTSAHLSYVFEKELGNSGEFKNQDSLHPLLHYLECFDRAWEFDVIHNHAQYYAMFFAELIKTPVVHTLHGSFSKESTPEQKLHTLRRFKHHNFVSISNSQRLDMPELNYAATVYNGINVPEFSFKKESGSHLIWFGRITPKKGPLEAIAVAKQLDMKIIVAGAIDDIDMPFFQKEIKPLIDNINVIYKSEIGYLEKSELLNSGLATLYPISWEEPFGLVMTESMACGTPVIAYNRGSVSEIIKDGVTGFIIDPDNQERPGKGSFVIKKQGIEGLVEAVKRIREIDRSVCRKHIEDNFSVEKMISGYEDVYKKILMH